MPKSYSADLRKRVIEAVEAGASRREAAESFGIDASSAVRWLERDWALRAEAPRRKRFSVGTTCRADIGSDGPTTGSDLGGDHCGIAQAADSDQ
jgi:transposase-like protein